MSADGAGLMRCDLHVHSWTRAALEVPILSIVGRECHPTRSTSTSGLTGGAWTS